MTVPTALLSAKSNEWYTPAKYIEAARQVMGSIELDPASCEEANRVVKAERYFTIEDNGLARAWIAKTLWLNPPYSNVKYWVDKIIGSHGAQWTDEAILLVNASTSERWFQPLWHYPICFTNHRIKFDSPDVAKTQPTKGNAFVYFGTNEARFVEVFSQFGAVVRRVG